MQQRNGNDDWYRLDAGYRNYYKLIQSKVKGILCFFYNMSKDFVEDLFATIIF